MANNDNVIEQDSETTEEGPVEETTEEDPVEEETTEEAIEEPENDSDEEEIDIENLSEEEKQELKQKTLQDIANNDNYMIRESVKHFIEEQLEKQRIKGFLAPDWDVVVYSSNPFEDANGEIYDATFAVSGMYEEKGNGALREFFAIIGYKNIDDIETGNSYLLYYLNADTDKYFSAVKEEDDILKQLQNLQ